MEETTSSHDDVAAEAAAAARRYVAADPAIAGDGERLAAAIARNRRCDLARRRQAAAMSLSDWLDDPERSNLDEVPHAELTSLLRSALGRLSADCRDLLRSLYVQGQSLEAVRVRRRLATIQSVSYRRSVCLRQVKSHVSRRLHARCGSDGPDDQPGYTCIDPRLGGELWRRDDPATDAGLAARLDTHVTFCAACRQQRAVEAATAARLRSHALTLGSTAGREIRRIRLVGGLGGLVLAAGLALMLLLPVAPPGGAVTVGIVRPVAGEVVPGPRPTLRWTGLDEVSSYHVAVTGVKSEYVWKINVAEPTARVPEDRPLPMGDRFRVVVQPVPAQLAPPGGLRATFATGRAGAFVAYRLRAGSPAGKILVGLGLAAVVTGALLMGRRRSLARALRDAL